MKLKKILSHSVPSRISLMIIGGMVLLILCQISYWVGKLSGLNNLPVSPAPTASPVSLDDRPEFNEIHRDYLRVEASSLLSIKDNDGLLVKRHRLIQFIWGHAGLPLNAMPAKIEQNIQHNPLEGLDTTLLDRMDRILVRMAFDLESRIYHLTPKRRTWKTLVIFHQGHLKSTSEEVALVNDLLEKGYAVGVFWMPLYGVNNQPSVFIPNLGYVRLQQHEHMKFLAPESGHPVQYFLQPVVEFINYALHASNPEHIAMVGLSGGGWTTTLMAAVDSRIDLSISVAGSYPIFLRSGSHRDWGDWEQTIPGLYQTCNYLELYILGSAGKGRKQLQIHNKYDSCCFAGMKWKTYRTTIAEHVAMIGEGAWDLYLDESHATHAISAASREKIIEALGSMASGQ